MADKYNAGTINIEAATNSIVSNGGGISEKTNADGSTHVSVYSTTENRHLSYDKDKDGNISNVHTDKDNHAYMVYIPTMTVQRALRLRNIHMDYKGGR